MPAAGAVSLRLHNPWSSEPDLELNEVPVQWTVARLKQELAEKFQAEGKPHSPTEIRLVYAGKQLVDSALLESVLRMDDGVQSHFMHMICKQPEQQQQQQQPAPSQAADSSFGLRHRGGPTRDSEARTARESLPQNHHHSHQQHHPSVSTEQHHLNAAWANASAMLEQWQHHAHRVHHAHHGFHGPEEHAANDTAAQQMYAQYLSQYMQYVHATAATVGATSAAAATLAAAHRHAAAVSFAPPMPGAPNEGPAAAAAAAPGAAAAPPAPAAAPAAGQAGPAPPGPQQQPGVVLNAGGGALGALEDEDENEGEQRDILDWVYIGCRVLVLFTIVYFYSSLYRFVLVTALGLLAYMYNAGFFHNHPNQGAAAQDQQDGRNEDQLIRREVNEVREAGHNDANHQNNADLDAPGVEQTRPDASEHGNAEEAETAAGDAANEVNPLVSAAGIVRSFFASLLPEQPAVA